MILFFVYGLNDWFVCFFLDWLRVLFLFIVSFFEHVFLFFPFPGLVEGALCLFFLAVESVLTCFFLFCSGLRCLLIFIHPFQCGDVCWCLKLL